MKIFSPCINAYHQAMVMMLILDKTFLEAPTHEGGLHTCWLQQLTKITTLAVCFHSLEWMPTFQRPGTPILIMLVAGRAGLHMGQQWDKQMTQTPQADLIRCLGVVAMVEGGGDQLLQMVFGSRRQIQGSCNCVWKVCRLKRDYDGVCRHQQPNNTIQILQCHDKIRSSKLSTLLYPVKCFAQWILL